MRFSLFSLWWIMFDDIIHWKYFPRYLPFAGNPSVTGGFPSQKTVMQSFDVLFDLRLNRPLSKEQRSRGLEMLSAHYDITVMEHTYNGNVVMLISRKISSCSIASLTFVVTTHRCCVMRDKWIPECLGRRTDAGLRPMWVNFNYRYSRWLALCWHKPTR